MLHELLHHDSNLSKTGYSRNGQYLASGDIEGEICIWEVDQDYQLLTSIQGHDDMIQDLAFSPGCVFLVTVAKDMSMRVWDVDGDYELIGTYYSPINFFGFSAENMVIVGEATGNRKNLKLLDAHI